MLDLRSITGGAGEIRYTGASSSASVNPANVIVAPPALVLGGTGALALAVLGGFMRFTELPDLSRKETVMLDVSKKSPNLAQ